jgi:hypothetical protein
MWNPGCAVLADGSGKGPFSESMILGVVETGNPDEWFLRPFTAASRPFAAQAFRPEHWQTEPP